MSRSALVIISSLLAAVSAWAPMLLQRSATLRTTAVRHVRRDRDACCMCAVEDAPDAADLTVITSAPPQYSVFLYNDGFNMREFVQRVLMMVAEVSEDAAMDIMMEANWGYRARIGT